MPTRPRLARRIMAMKLAVVAHHRTEVNEALAAAAGSLGLRGSVLTPAQGAADARTR